MAEGTRERKGRRWFLWKGKQLSRPFPSPRLFDSKLGNGTELPPTGGSSLCSFLRWRRTRLQNLCSMVGRERRFGFLLSLFAPFPPPSFSLNIYLMVWQGREGRRRWRLSSSLSFACCRYVRMRRTGRGERERGLSGKGEGGRMGGKKEITLLFYPLLLMNHYCKGAFFTPAFHFLYFLRKRGEKNMFGLPRRLLILARPIRFQSALRAC